MTYSRLALLLLLLLPALVCAQQKKPQVTEACTQCAFTDFGVAATFPVRVQPQVNDQRVLALADAQGYSYKLMATQQQEVVASGQKAAYLQVYARTYMRALGDGELLEQRMVTWLGQDALEMTYQLPKNGTLYKVVHRVQMLRDKTIVAEVYRPATLPPAEAYEPFFAGVHLMD